MKGENGFHISRDSNMEDLSAEKHLCLGEKAACPEGVAVVAPQWSEGKRGQRSEWQRAGRNTDPAHCFQTSVPATSLG